jgi:CheY-like chemotaxis protein
MARILVVDDEDAIRNLFKEFLEERGHEVTTANCAEEALEKIKEGQEIILLDIIMPGMSGLDVLERIKEIAPSTEVIMITALSFDYLGLECWKRGAFEFLAKPIDLKHLEGLIDLKLLQMYLEGASQEKDIITNDCPVK